MRGIWNSGGFDCGSGVSMYGHAEHIPYRKHWQTDMGIQKIQPISPAAESSIILQVTPQFIFDTHIVNMQNGLYLVASWHVSLGLKQQSVHISPICKND